MAYLHGYQNLKVTLTQLILIDTHMGSVWDSRNLPKAPGHDPSRELNPRPSDLCSSAPPTRPQIPTMLRVQTD